jgi:acyl dehydratase
VVDHIQAGAGSSPVTVPSPEKVASGGLSMVAPSHHEVKFDLGEYSFSWPHPVLPGEALFKVDDAAEQAIGEVTSRGHDGV